jgi:hypothetical protein
MANRTLQLNASEPNYNKKVHGLHANGADDGINDPLLDVRFYRVVGYIVGDGTGDATIQFRAPASGEVGPAIALETDQSQTIDLHTACPDHLFPANVYIMGGTYVNVRDAVTGVTSPTITVGDAGAANGLVTSSALTAGFKLTLAAAEHHTHPEAAFIPVIVVGCSTEDLDEATGGIFEIVIPYAPLPI